MNSNTRTSINPMETVEDSPPVESKRPETTTPASRRQRVAVACDVCRRTRQKCDGMQPHCNSCVANNSQCSYKPKLRKRGIPSGYLRNLELVLGYIFMRIPDSEDLALKLLANGVDGLSFDQVSSSSSEALHKRWLNSPVHQNIKNLQFKAQGTVGTNDQQQGSRESLKTTMKSLEAPCFRNASSDFTGNSIYSTFQDNNQQGTACALSLPSDWRSLLDVYKTFTHCWFPIADFRHVTNAALNYSVDDTYLSGALHEPSFSHAELWSVLALAAFQDESRQVLADTSYSKARQYFAAARQMTPSEQTACSLSQLRALLLQVLVLLGRGSHLAAWTMVGTATRQALCLTRPGGSSAEQASMPQDMQREETLILMACSILETLASASSKQASLFQYQANYAESASCQHASFGTRIKNGSNFPSHDVQDTAFDTFSQLYKISQELGQSLNWKAGSEHFASISDPISIRISVELRPDKSDKQNCGGHMSSLLSFLLLQAISISAAIPKLRDSQGQLVSLVLNIVDSYIVNMGIGCVPPVIGNLIHILRTHGYLDNLVQAEKVKMDLNVRSMEYVWGRESDTNDHPTNFTTISEQPTDPLSCTLNNLQTFW
ncbi:hypothetical protein S40285_08318 [Stachybotrys chlorohalonatus IBT 40285]|uniref:Zn(2)-C6 fungal-type domain-containing protein n=1 Tax=Stachybotrys chlorohalonatus (strain IBT 40285) TaxID=1283841 RepID=A0A084QP30_STAC4|nr:hypothetical protein S40285_08318 [Stachybotrys chlorohalonata IBT 40285]